MKRVKSDQEPPHQLIVEVQYKIPLRRTVNLGQNGISPEMLVDVRGRVSKTLNVDANSFFFVTEDNELVDLADGVSCHGLETKAKKGVVTLRMVSSVGNSVGGSDPMCVEGGHPPHIRETSKKRFQFDQMKLQGYEFLAAAEAGCIPCLEMLLNENPNLITFKSDSMGYSATDFAIWGKQTEAVEQAPQYIQKPPLF
jgi:hypothetical protein